MYSLLSEFKKQSPYMLNQIRENKLATHKSPIQKMYYLNDLYIFQ